MSRGYRNEEEMLKKKFNHRNNSDKQEHQEAGRASVPHCPVFSVKDDESTHNLRLFLRYHRFPVPGRLHKPCL